MGIKEIEDRIIREAEEKARHIRDEAQGEAFKLIAEAKQKIAEAHKISETAARADAEVLLTELLSPVRISQKNDLLGRKKEITDNVYQESLKSFSGLSKADYERAMLCLLGRLPKGASGSLMPAKGREDETKRALQSFMKDGGSGAKIVMGKPKAQMSGGFVFIGEKFNIDMSFECLMDQLKDETYSEVSDMLFEEK